MSKSTIPTDPREARRQQILRLIEQHALKGQAIKSQAALSEELEKAGIDQPFEISRADVEKTANQSSNTWSGSKSATSCGIRLRAVLRSASSSVTSASADGSGNSRVRRHRSATPSP